MRVLFAGTPEAAVPSLRALLDSRHEVLAVLTRPDAPRGRGRTLRASPVAELARQAGVEVLQPQRPGELREPEFQGRLEHLAPDVAPIVAYGGLIPRSVLVVPRHGWVNLHFSLLPAWRGAAPVQHAVIAGDDVTGASTFRLEEDLDSGPVYGTVIEPIHDTDTSGDVLARLAHSGAELLMRTLETIEAGTAAPQPQPPDGVTLAPRLEVADARIDWTVPALALDRHVRGCTPVPGAWTMLSGGRFKVRPVTLEPGREDLAELAPGEIVVERSGVRVGTGSHAVVLGDVQPPGKRFMPAVDWARGADLAPGDRFDAEQSATAGAHT